MSTLPAVTVPAQKDHSATVIFLHGLGDTGRGWAPQMAEFAESLPHVKFVLPNAPVAPVTLNGGMRMTSWHDIKNLTTIDAEDFKGLAESRALVEAALQAEIAAGVPSHRILLGGFSQGAAMAVFTGFQFAKRLAGVICFSGYLPFNGDFGKALSAENKTTACLVCHGLSDMVVNPKAGAKVNETLSSLGVPCTYRTYKNVAHSSCDAELVEALAFIKKCLPANDKAASAPAAAKASDSA